MGVLGVDMVNLRRRRNEEGERAREGEVSRVRRLGGVSATVGWRHQEQQGRGAPCHRRIQGGQSGRDLDCQGIVEIAAVDLRSSRTVSWLPWIKRPLAARSGMSAGSGR